jgi:hypothetical protein
MAWPLLRPQFPKRSSTSSWLKPVLEAHKFGACGRIDLEFRELVQGRRVSGQLIQVEGVVGCRRELESCVAQSRQSLEVGIGSPHLVLGDQSDQ